MQHTHTEKKKQLPSGLVLIKNVYLVLAMLSAFTAVFISPYTTVLFYGEDLGGTPSIIVNCVLVVFSLLLFLGFNRPSLTIWYLAFVYHIFFIANNFIGVLSFLFPQAALTSVIQISGMTTFAPASQKEPMMRTTMRLFSLFNITLLVGLFILWYLWREKEHFIPKRFLKKL